MNRGITQEEVASDERTDPPRHSRRTHVSQEWPEREEVAVRTRTSRGIWEPGEKGLLKLENRAPEVRGALPGEVTQARGGLGSEEVDGILHRSTSGCGGDRIHI